ncbi:MAG: response regulator [Bacteroidales bacterium]
MQESHSEQKILVVDDDDISFYLVSEILAAYPFKVIRATNGKEALDYFKEEKNPFDLIIMDIRMPEMNGYEATQEIKKIDPSVPVIALTAYAHYQGKIDCITAGCDEFIAKPFNINFLLNAIQKHLN